MADFLIYTRIFSNVIAWKREGSNVNVPHLALQGAVHFSPRPYVFKLGAVHLDWIIAWLAAPA